MDTSAINELASRAIYVAFTLMLPILMVCLAVGIVVSIFQAVTQIHEQSLSFVPKVAAIVALLVAMGSWMAGQLESFLREIFNTIANL